MAPRCNRYGNNCRYRYNGYYYASPWWLLPAVGATVIIGGSNNRRPQPPRSLVLQQLPVLQ